MSMPDELPGIRGYREKVDLDSAECRVSVMRRIVLPFIWIGVWAPLTGGFALILWHSALAMVDGDVTKSPWTGFFIVWSAVGFVVLVPHVFGYFFHPPARLAQAGAKGLCFDGGPILAWDSILHIREKGFAVKWWHYRRFDPSSLVRAILSATGGLVVEYRGQNGSRRTRRIPLYASRYEWMRVYLGRKLPGLIDYQLDRTEPGNY
jgi:hypothetical protein